jgi:hypothetical protein
VTNGGFEGGKLANWSSFQSVKVRVDGTHSHQGRFSLAELDGVGSAYQDVDGLTSGGHYTISAWVSGSPGTTATAQIALLDAANNVATFSDHMTPQPKWQLVTHKIVLGQGRSLRLHLVRNKGAGTVYSDDLRIDRDK